MNNMSIVTVVGYIAIGLGCGFLGAQAKDKKELAQNLAATLLVMTGMFGVITA